MTWLYLLLIGFLTDIVWVMWMDAVAKLKPWKSGFWGVMTSVVGLIAIVNIVENHWHTIPYLIGMFCGSVVGVYYKRKA